MSDLKELVEQERKERIEKATEILKDAIKQIEELGCVLDISVLVTGRGNVPQLNVLSKE